MSEETNVPVDSVVFDESVNGQQVKITAGECLQSPELASALLYAGIKRILNSAATNKADDESADSARLRRALQIKAGELWSRGGGHTLSDAERARRDILASYATTYASLKRSVADEMARKDAEGLLAKTAEAILVRKAEGKKPGKDRLASGIENFRQKVEAEVQKRLKTATDMEI